MVIKIVKGRSGNDMTHRKRVSALLTTSEVALQLNVHVNTVRRWSNRGVVKVYRIGPRGDRRFRKEDIDGFLTELKPNRGSGSKAAPSGR